MRAPPGAGRAAGWTATGAAVLLAACALALALAGPALVPAAADDAPGWILGAFGDGLGLSPGLFLGLLYAAIVAWALLTGLAPRSLDRALWLLIAALIAVFTLAPPFLSLDIFSYISYGRLGVEGLNPYEFTPEAIAGDQAADRVEDFSSAISVYGPLFTLLTYPLAAVGVSFALWSLKLVAGLSVVAIALLTARLAVLRGLPPAPAAAFVALNPLVLVHVVGGGHNDGLMVALALAGALLLLTARPRAASVSMIAAVAVKAAAAVYLPFAVLGAPAGRSRVRLVAGLIGAGVVCVALSLLVFGPASDSAIAVAGDNQGTVSHWSVPGTLARVFGADPDPIRYAFAGLLGLWLLALGAWVLRGADWVRVAGWAMVGILLASASLLPWYLIWALPLAAVARDRLLVFVTIALTVFQAINSVPV